MRRRSLMIEWESPWTAFWDSVAVVLSKGKRRSTAYQVRTGIPLRLPLISIAGHFLIAAVFVVVVPWQILSFTFTAVPLQDQSTDFSGAVIYYVNHDLPAISGENGAEEGATGSSGGRHLFRAGQTIRIIRGERPVETLADAPTLHLPVTNRPVADLLVVSVAPPSPDALLKTIHAGHRQIEVPGERVAPMQAKQEEPKPAPTVRVDVARTRLSEIQPPAPPLTANPPALVIPDEPDLAAARAKLPLPTTRASEFTALPVTVKSVEISSVELVAHAPSPAPMANALEASGNPGASNGQATVTDVVITSHPGTEPGIPAGASRSGVVVISSFGGNAAGQGGVGRGTGIGNGSGSGSGNGGTGPGSGKSGTGPGSSPNAHGGITGGSGPGGAGGSGHNKLAGISISGGVVTLPSFATNTDASAPRRSGSESRAPSTIVVVGTSRSGGALPLYGLLRGSRVYTIYFEVKNASTVVLQYSDPTSTVVDSEITPPEPLQTRLLSVVEHSKTVIAGVIDGSGVPQRLHVIEAVRPELGLRLLQHIRNWRFRPATRDGKAIEVEAVFGFAVDTN